MSKHDTSKHAKITNIDEASEWLSRNMITSIECMVIDQAGAAKGKIMPSSKFAKSPNISLPHSVFHQTVTGDYPELNDLISHVDIDSDLVLPPDLSTLRIVPWNSTPTAQVIHDAYFANGDAVSDSPRHVLKRVLGLYEGLNLRPIVAPELEFYLVKQNKDADYPLEPPKGRSGRAEISGQSYSIFGLNEFSSFSDDVNSFAQAQGLDVDTLVHEEGPAQMEINLLHGDPLDLADAAFLFKRTIRETAHKHGIYATFMAKPIASEPGSAFHIHTSVVDRDTGDNIFSQADGTPSRRFYNYLAGLQTYLPAMTIMIAPYVNSYRRLTKSSEHSGPINMRWGFDNRTTGLRVPPSTPENRRIENRVPSSDANSYLAMSASLAAGYLGIKQNLTPSQPLQEDARQMDYELPRTLDEALSMFSECDELNEVFTSGFVEVYKRVKMREIENFLTVISPWEREHLLLNV